MAELVTQREYVEAMEGMFHSAGWRHWKAKLVALHESALESLSYNQFNRLEDFLGLQREVQALERLLGIEEDVRRLRALLVENPDEGAFVVQSVDKDPEIEKVIGPLV